MSAVNPFLGETELVVGETTYGLVFDANALCYAEEALGMDTDEILAGAKGMRVTRGLLWGALQKKHPGLHLIAVGEIITEAGLAASRAAVMKGLKAALGLEKEGEESPDPPQPAEAAGDAGTG